MRKLNKKGAIIGGISESIGNVIQGITNILPKPVLFIIFLFIVAFLGWIISIIFNASGVFCNSAGQPVQLNTNILTNIALIDNIPASQDLGTEQISPEKVVVLSQLEETQECSSLETEGTYTILEDDASLFLANLGIFQGEKYNITQPTWFYYASNTDATICTKVRVEATAGNIPVVRNYNGCLGDVYRRAETDKTYFQKKFAGCEPPPHYYFESVTGKYNCADTTCEGITIATAWDELLASKGATLKYKDYSNELNPSSEYAMGITCSELRPKLAIFGYDFLNLSTVIFITIIIILFWIYFKIK